MDTRGGFSRVKRLMWLRGVRGTDRKVEEEANTQFTAFPAFSYPRPPTPGGRSSSYLSPSARKGRDREKKGATGSSPAMGICNQEGSAQRMGARPGAVEALGAAQQRPPGTSCQAPGSAPRVALDGAPSPPAALTPPE